MTGKELRDIKVYYHLQLGRAVPRSLDHSTSMLWLCKAEYTHQETV